MRSILSSRRVVSLTSSFSAWHGKQTSLNADGDGMHPNSNKEVEWFDNQTHRGGTCPLTFTVLEFLNGHNFIGLLQHRAMSEKSMCRLSLYQNTPAEMKVHGAHKRPLLLSDCLICTVHVQISAELRIKSDGSLLGDFVFLFPDVF